MAALENIDDYLIDDLDFPNIWTVVIPAIIFGILFGILSINFYHTLRNHTGSDPTGREKLVLAPVSSATIPYGILTETPTATPTPTITGTATAILIDPTAITSTATPTPEPAAVGQDYRSFLDVIFNRPTATMTPSPTPTSSPTPTATPLPGTQKMTGRDGIPQVYISGGPFLMGRPAGDEGLEHDQPQHKIELDAFWIGLTPVTNSGYSRCVAAGACAEPCSIDTNPSYYDPAYASYPVVYVVWQSAQNYCQWAGGRLPTEAEWERAAGGGFRLYAWGEDDPTENYANLGGVHGTTMPVGSYPAGASPFGVLDMGGNVREWVSDWYSLFYYQVSPAANPTGPTEGTEKVLRGASWNDPWYYAKVTRRYAHDPNSAGANRGFRCVYTQ